MLSRFIRKPSVHFWALGLLLFSLDRSFNQPEDIRTVNYPEPRVIEQLRGQWLATAGRPPTVTDMQRMIQYELDQSILLNEALRLELHYYDSVVQQRLLRDMRFMGDNTELSDYQLLEQAYAMQLHVNDTVVKRRLMQAMESIYRAPGEAQPPSREQLDQIYQQRIDEFTLPATRQVSHVFVSGDRHGADAKARAQQLFDNFSKDDVALASARSSTDPFLSGLDFSQLSARQLARHFGERFANQVFECEGVGWCGPIESPYGWHVVYVHGEQSARQQDFEAVEQKVRYYFKRQQGDIALADKMDELRSIYQVVGAPPSDASSGNAEAAP